MTAVTAGFSRPWGGTVNVLFKAHGSEHNRPPPPGAGDPPKPNAPGELPPVDPSGYWFNAPDAFSFKKNQQQRYSNRTQFLFEEAKHKQKRWQNRMWDPPVKIGISRALKQISLEEKAKLAAARKAKPPQPHVPRQKGIIAFDPYLCHPSQHRRQRRTFRAENKLADQQYKHLSDSRSNRRQSTQNEYQVDKARHPKKEPTKPDGLFKAVETTKLVNWEETELQNEKLNKANEKVRQRLLKKQRPSAIRSKPSIPLKKTVVEEPKEGGFPKSVYKALEALSLWLEKFKMKPHHLLEHRNLNEGSPHKGSTGYAIPAQETGFDAAELVGLWKRVGSPMSKGLAMKLIRELDGDENHVVDIAELEKGLKHVKRRRRTSIIKEQQARTPTNPTTPTK